MKALIEFIVLADTETIVHLWEGFCEMIDRHGDTPKFKKCMLEDGKEEYQVMVANDEGI